MTLLEDLESEAKRLMRSAVNDSKYSRHERADDSRARAGRLRSAANRIRAMYSAATSTAGLWGPQEAEVLIRVNGGEPGKGENE